MPLKRVLEPEVMETLEEARTYDAMDHREVNQRFVEDLISAGEPAGEVLDVGTGTAQIPILLCQADAEVRVLGIDLSCEMLDVARSQIEIHSQRERILLDRIDAKAMPFADGRFDIVMSNSIVHHIPKPQQVVAEAVRVCKPDGLLFFRDLMRPSSQHEIDQLVTTYAGHEDAVAKKMFEDSLHAALTLAEFQAIVSELGFAKQTVTATSDRHWTWQAVKGT